MKLLSVQMILPAVHQLLHTVQKDNIGGSDLLQLLHSKVVFSPFAAVCWQAVPGCMCIHTAPPSMLLLGNVMNICRLSVESQSCSPV